MNFKVEVISVGSGEVRGGFSRKTLQSIDDIPIHIAYKRRSQEWNAGSLLESPVDMDLVDIAAGARGVEQRGCEAGDMVQWYTSRRVSMACGVNAVVD